MTLSPRARSWLEMQGYEGLSDAELSEIVLWTRFSLAVCMTFAAVGGVLGSAWIMGALASTAAIGALLPMHPFDTVYIHGIRRVTHGPALPPNPAPRRVACAVAALADLDCARVPRPSHAPRLRAERRVRVRTRHAHIHGILRAFVHPSVVRKAPRSCARHVKLATEA